jgi:hypothetical protein
MGMYDKEPNFGETFAEGDRFVLLGAEYVGTIKTKFGSAEKSIFTIVSRDHPSVKRQYAVLGDGFAGQARRSERADFPHVAEYTSVPTASGNRVKLLARVDVDPLAFIDGDDGPALTPVLTPEAVEEGESILF